MSAQSPCFLSCNEHSINGLNVSSTRPKSEQPVELFRADAFLFNPLTEMLIVFRVQRVKWATVENALMNKRVSERAGE